MLRVYFIPWVLLHVEMFALWINQMEEVIPIVIIILQLLQYDIIS